MIMVRLSYVDEYGIGLGFVVLIVAMERECFVMLSLVKTIAIFLLLQACYATIINAEKKTTPHILGSLKILS